MGFSVCNPLRFPRLSRVTVQVGGKQMLLPCNFFVSVPLVCILLFFFLLPFVLQNNLLESVSLCMRYVVLGVISNLSKLETLTLQTMSSGPSTAGSREAAGTPHSGPATRSSASTSCLLQLLLLGGTRRRSLQQQQPHNEARNPCKATLNQQLCSSSYSKSLHGESDYLVFVCRA